MAIPFALHTARSLMLLLAAAALIAPPSGAAARKVALSINPDKSASSWKVQNPDGLEIAVSPRRFRLAGPLDLELDMADDGRTVRQVIWLPMHITTLPETFEVRVGMGEPPLQLGQFSVSNPSVVIDGGEVELGPGGNFSFSASGGVIGVGFVQGGVLGMDLHKEGIRVRVPGNRLPQVKGTITIADGKVHIKAQTAVQVGFGDIAQAASNADGVAEGVSNLMANGSINIKLRLDATGDLPNDNQWQPESCSAHGAHTCAAATN